MTLAALRRALLEQGGTVARTVAPEAAPGEGAPGEAAPGDGATGEATPGEDRTGPPQLAARGPRAAGSEREYELLLEMILEGSLLHYGSARVVLCDDPDLALLLGDQLYALGLSRLAALGDLDAVAELADLISLLAQAQAAGDPGLADAVWEAGAVAIGWGAAPELEAAKARARAGDSQAADALRRAVQKALHSTAKGPVA